MNFNDPCRLGTDIPRTVQGSLASVLFVVPRFHTNLYFATKALKDAGVGVHVLCAASEGIEDHSVLKPIVVTDEEVSYRRLSLLLNDINPDLVVIRHTGKISRVIFWLCLAQGKNTIGYDLRPYLRPRNIGRVIHGFFRGRPLRRITPVYGSPKSGARGDRFATYLPFPVQSDDSRNRAYTPDNTVRILCVGKLAERRKNHLLLLKALEPLASEFRFHVTLAGNSGLAFNTSDQAYLEEVMGYAEKGPLAAQLSIAADIPFKDMASVYDAHDICVLPARREPLGIAPLEAMARGCAAVISSDSGSAYYVTAAAIAGVPCGTVFAADSCEDLRKACREMLEDRERISQFGRNAAKWVRQEFSPETYVEKFLALIPRKHK